MGDRANVYVHAGDQPGVYLYTHWYGNTLPDVVRAALERGEDRWRDTSYLARVIFNEMTMGREQDTRGFGISDTALQRVRVGDRVVDFGKYVAAHEQRWDGAEE